MTIHNVYLRFDADGTTGAGHLVRCITIGKALAVAGCRVYWVGKNLSPELATILPLDTGSLLKIDPQLTWSEEIGWLMRHASLQDATVVLDVTTRHALDNLEDFAVYLGNLKNHCRVILIDGLAEDAVLGSISVRPNVAVIPYVGAVDSKVSTEDGCRWLLGPSYFVLHPEYQKITPSMNDVAKTARRILVTFGGTDPKGSTLMALDAIAGLQAPALEIRTVIGPGFSTELKSAIHAKENPFGQAWSIEDAPENLAQLISWCDVAVSASGLTKYELAAMGKPSVQVSLNRAHANAVEPFVATGVTRHLGIADDITTEDMRTALEQLIQSQGTRKRMNTACNKLMDIRGTDRVVAAILDIAEP